jgi:hypothetical protein
MIFSPSLILFELQTSMSKRECHPKFSESHSKEVEYHRNSKNPKYEMNVTQN